MQTPQPTTQLVAPSGRADESHHAPATGGRFRVALVGGASTSGSVDLAEQLRKRLRAIAAMLAASMGAGLLLRLILNIHTFLGPSPERAQQFNTALAHLGVTLIAIWALFRLRPRPHFTLLSARRTEALIVVATVLFLTVHQVGVLILEHDYISLHPLTHSGASALPWAMSVVAYGVLIPNTWRRCAAVLGLVVAVALLGTGLGFILAPQSPRVVTLFFVQKAIWMGTAAAIVVYGAYRIEILQDQAELGRELGHYRLGRHLGAGGMGEVYLAEHTLLRRPCAIKLIRPEWAGDPKHLLRFEREVRATATLTHPNTVQVFDYGHASDGTFYCVMEFLPGVTLEHLVKTHGPLPPGRAVHFLRQVCDALQEAHAIGLIHRDIKPGNVMTCERGALPDVVKLLDFGLVLPVGTDEDGKLTQEGALTGTPAYMSPEQVGGQENLDARSDIYSIGALAYFLLTGQPPFGSRPMVKVLAAHLYETPGPLAERCPGVPADLEAVVLRCLAKDPADRFPSVESLKSALAECRSVTPWTPQEAAAWWHSQPD
jgi:hypothetical protein